MSDVRAAARARRWETVRYRWLLPATSESQARGAAYAQVCARVEMALDPHRAVVAAARIGRWLGVVGARTRSIYYRALVSEAREEADSCWLMSDDGRLAAVSADLRPPPLHDGPAVWGSLHFGSPVLAYLYLRCIRGLDVQIIGRPLDERNPMSEAKQAWGRRKVDWVERVTRVPVLGVSPEATSAARSRLVRGRSLCFLMDVPGDVTARRMALPLGGERVSFASGVLLLAGMVGVPVFPLVVVRRGAGFEVVHGPRIDPVEEQIPFGRVGDAIEGFVRAMPEEWWLWPYLPVVGDAS